MPSAKVLLCENFCDTYRKIPSVPFLSKAACLGFNFRSFPVNFAKFFRAAILLNNRE